MLLRVGMGGQRRREAERNRPLARSLGQQDSLSSCPLPQPSARFGNDDQVMITAGVDLSSQTAHTASCIIEWSGRSANCDRP